MNKEVPSSLPCHVFSLQEIYRGNVCSLTVRLSVTDHILYTSQGSKPEYFMTINFKFYKANKKKKEVGKKKKLKLREK